MDGIWETLRRRTEYAAFVPRPIADIERVDLRRRDGTAYTMLKNPHGARGAGLYLRLEPEDMQLFDLMDGRRDIQEIVIEHLQRQGVFAIDRLARLTASLAANGFFGEERPRVYERLATRRAMRDPLIRAAMALRRLVMWDIAQWANANATVELLYRWGGRLAFTRVGVLLIAALCILGLAAWVSELRAARHGLITLEGSYTAGILSLIVLQVLSISVHELGHALAICHYGRRVRRLGLAMYYLFPCVYVDSTDMAMTPRRPRIVVALAGPIGGLTVGALCAVVAGMDGGLAGDLAFKAASLFIFQFALNLLPILELDGYHILVDLLDAPLLRQRAIAFARASVLTKLRRRQPWTRTELGLATYGVLAIVTSLGMLVFALTLWQSRVAAAATELFRTGPLGALVVLALVVVFIGPLVVALAARIAAWARDIARASAARRRRARQGEIVERAHALSRVPFLAGLPAPALAAIASHLVPHEVAPGTSVVTIGEPGDRFYLVRSGRLDVLGPDDAVLGSLGPGDGFGELALLDDRPRSATVRAAEPSSLWSLDRGHFERWIRERFEIAARIRASAEERAALAALPFFRDLQPQELGRILPRLVAVRVPAGETVFREGDVGDRYYIVRAGEADVRVGETVVRRMGPGSGFGDLALLLGRPRSATVTAVSDLELAALSRADFAWLVRASGETRGDFQARTAHYVGAGLGSAVRGE